MANYFFTDANGKRQGPYTERQLQSGIAKGIITPQTPLETDSGHKGLAGQIPGLKFNTAVPPAGDQSAGKSVNYFYFDQTNQKQGPVSESHLHVLAAQGTIGPMTPLETDGGYRGTAGQVPGLFPAGTTSSGTTTAGATSAQLNAFANTATTKGKEFAQRGIAGLSKGAGEVMSGLSAATAAAQARIKLNGLNAQLVDAYRSLGDAAEQGGWGGELCEAIRTQKEEVAAATAQHGKAASDAELAKNTPGTGAAKQALSEAKTRMTLAAGILDGLREKAGRTLMDDASAPPHIGVEQRSEILRLMREITEYETIVAHGKKSLMSKPMLAAAGVVVALLVVVALFTGGGNDPLADNDPSSVVRQFHVAIERGDMRTIRRITTPEVAQMVAIFGEKLKYVVEATGGIRRISHTINGNTAIVTVTYRYGPDGDRNPLDETFELEKIGGRWKIGIGGSFAPPAPPPPPAVW